MNLNVSLRNLEAKGITRPHLHSTSEGVSVCLGDERMVLTWDSPEAMFQWANQLRSFSFEMREERDRRTKACAATLDRAFGASA